MRFARLFIFSLVVAFFMSSCSLNKEEFSLFFREKEKNINLICERGETGEGEVRCFLFGKTARDVLFLDPRHNLYCVSTFLTNRDGVNIRPIRPLAQTMLSSTYYFVYSRFTMKFNICIERKITYQYKKNKLTIGLDEYGDLPPGEYELHFTYFARFDDYDEPLNSIDCKFVGELVNQEKIKLIIPALGFSGLKKSNLRFNHGKEGVGVSK